jgi:Dyp-type peroxidase family
MASLKDILATSIPWTQSATDPDLGSFLHDLQAHILKHHGRKHAAHLFLSFAGMAPAAVAGVLRVLGSRTTSAHEQLSRSLSAPPFLDGGTVTCVFLSAGGYRALGPLARLPDDEAFGAGMAARREVLSDPPRSDWSSVGWAEGPAPDAMVLLADKYPKRLDDAIMAVEGWLNGTGARVLVIERGNQQHKQFQPGKEVGVEHFGYMDGRSQPLFLKEELNPEPKVNWDPSFEPRRYIVADPNGRGPRAAGAYFVFRKLEQDVRGFKRAESALADALFGPATAANKELRERAGAMVVGRFEDGTPITLEGEAKKAVPPPNDFTFAADAQGLRCPFHAHIRKTNPRGDVRREFKLEDDEGDRHPIMARRGITYGEDRPLNAAKDDFDDDGHEPTGDVGLLFMAYMADIAGQFEFTQKMWANNEDFVRGGTGIDPVIGQGGTAGARDYKWLDGHTHGAQVKQASFASFVRMLGGEYFFAPSLSFLRGVGLT